MTGKKWLDQILAVSPGWHFEGYSRNGHIRLRHESGALWFGPGTPGGGRAMQNLRADLRRAARKTTPPRDA